MVKKMREEVLLWLNDSKRSLNIAKKNFDLELYEVAVFYCQQCLEKLLKGSVLHFRKKLVKTHRLDMLYVKVSREVSLSQEFINFIKMIMPYYTITRYPDITMGLPIDVVTKEFAKECIEKTEMISKCFHKVILKG